MSSVDEKSQSYYVSYNQYGNYFCIGRLFDNAGQFDSTDSCGFRYCGPQAENIYGTLVSKFILTKLIFKLSFVKVLMPQSCALWQQVMNHLLAFFIFMSCTGKWQFFYKKEVMFLQICAGNVLAFMENNTKIKKQVIFICFPET